MTCYKTTNLRRKIPNMKPKTKISTFTRVTATSVVHRSYTSILSYGHLVYPSHSPSLLHRSSSSGRCTVAVALRCALASVSVWTSFPGRGVVVVQGSAGGGRSYCPGWIRSAGRAAVLGLGGWRGGAWTTCPTANIGCSMGSI